MRRLTDPIGWCLMEWMQDGDIEEFTKDQFPTESDSGEPGRYFEVTERFLESFGKRSVKYVRWTIIVLAGMLFVDWIVCGRLPNQTSGIAINFLGSVILARSVMKGPYSIIAISAGFGSSNAVTKHQIGSAVDGPWGVFLILLGFAIQYIAIIGRSLPPVGCVL